MTPWCQLEQVGKPRPTQFYWRCENSPFSLRSSTFTSGATFLFEHLAFGVKFITMTSSRCTRNIPMILCLNFFAIVAFIALSTAAFQMNRQAKTLVVMHAWSLPNDGSFAFRSWYNEYNPTARVTVYNE
jgi:hypothetical protein